MHDLIKIFEDKITEHIHNAQKVRDEADRETDMTAYGTIIETMEDLLESFEVVVDSEFDTEVVNVYDEDLSDYVKIHQDLQNESQENGVIPDYRFFENLTNIFKDLYADFRVILMNITSENCRERRNEID